MPPRKAPAKAKKPTPKSKEVVESPAPAPALDSDIKEEQSVTQVVVQEIEMKTDVGSVNESEEDKDRVVNTTTTTTEEVVTTEIMVKEVTSVTEEQYVDEEPMEDDEDVDEEPMEDDEDEDPEMNLTEEDAKTPDDNNNLLVDNDGSNGEGEAEEIRDDNDSEEDDKDEDPDEIVHDSLTDTKKEKDLEIFVGGLDKEAVEDDLIAVFGKFGEIKSARVARKSSTKRSKGFGFIQYATVGEAMHALSELSDGIEVRGKRVRVSISQDKNTLHVANICDTWTKEQVVETLKKYGIEHIEEIQLPDDPENEGKNKGFAYLHFSRHPNALEAFQRLKKPDAVFGLDRSAKVAFTKIFMHPSEEDLAQIKRVYVEGLTDDWNEEKMDSICKEYGEITEVKLVRNKRKYFGFISFTSRESALACVEGINNAQIGEGDVKLKANLAKPQFKDRHQKQGFSGGFAVHKTAKSTPAKRRDSERAKQRGSSEMKSLAKSKRAKRRGKLRAEGKGKKSLSESKIVDGGKPTRPQSGGTNSGTPKRKRENLPSHAGGRPRRDVERGNSKRSHGEFEHSNGKRPQGDSERGNGPSKKRRGNERGRDSKDFRKPRRDDRVRRDGSSYHLHAVTPSSKRHRTDMEPHAGFLGPVTEQRGGSYAEYPRPAVVPYAGYLVPASGAPRYREPAVWTQGPTHGGYHEPLVGIHGQPQSGYVQPKHTHDPYDRRLRRDDAPGSSGSAYGGAPPPYASSYPSYAGYEGQGGGYYQSSGAHVPPRRSYY